MSTNHLAQTGQVGDHASRDAGLQAKLHKLSGNHGRLLGRLHHNAVARRQRTHRHAAEDGEWEVPGRYDRANAHRVIEELVELARQVTEPGRRRHHRGRSLRVEVAEVDGLGHVGVCLAPALANLQHHPGREVVAARPHQCGKLPQMSRARMSARIAPDGEGRARSLDRRVGVGDARRPSRADDLGGVGRIQRNDALRGRHLLAANEQRIDAAKAPAHPR